MKLRVLGSAGAEFPGFHPPAFLIDETLLFDAGTIGAVLSEDEQWGITHIFVTHAHLDHVRGIPALADNVSIKILKHNVKVIGTAAIIQALREHLMNNIIWPDFSRLPSEASPVITYVELEPGNTLLINGYSITAFPVSHSIPAVGYVIEKDKVKLLYSGDTGPTDTLVPNAVDLAAMIIEVSFPNAMEEMALLTGHLTPRLLEKELAKLSTLPPRILITHPKPQHYAIIKAELDTIGIPQIVMLTDGASYSL